MHSTQGLYLRIFLVAFSITKIKRHLHAAGGLPDPETVLEAIIQLPRGRHRRAEAEQLACEKAGSTAQRTWGTAMPGTRPAVAVTRWECRRQCHHLGSSGCCLENKGERVPMQERKSLLFLLSPEPQQGTFWTAGRRGMGGWEGAWRTAQAG